MIGLACASLSCDGFGDHHFVSSMRLMPQIGYRHIELNCWYPSDLTPLNIRRLQLRCAEAGLKPIAVYGSSFGGSNHHEISKDVCHKLRMIDAARELGCHRIVATGGARGQQGGMEAVLTALRQVVPYSEERGVLICLENHASNNLEFIEDYEHIFSELDSPNLGVCADTGHFEASGLGLDEVAARLHNRIHHIHVKETARKGEEVFVKFGQGVTDNRRFIDMLLGHGYQGYITVELAIEDKSNLLQDLSVPYRMFSTYEQQGRETVNE
ncbi:sugar phosphate isomerase/epimerase family protein [Paenibacillus abyssi]|uniref:Xylose isomerase n=1 Tax=Paenibacillus abyssi TaxID=1340531 RepID=A0A917FRT0_9BACL|nr:sugar phosphate isomerase/epimerase family protein [Paenibacillus abyssi]GGG02253.1 xylose isomerase [Paenibacillus abyssi]